MKRSCSTSFSRNLLRKSEAKPITGKRYMQISSVSNSPVVPLERSTPSQSGQETSSSDTAEFNFSADTFSSFVQEASNTPDVRSELVDSYKARIHSGHYPAQDVIAGLTRLIGGGVAQITKAMGNSSTQTTSTSTSFPSSTK